MVYGLYNKILLNMKKKWNTRRKFDAIKTQLKFRKMSKSKLADKTLLRFSDNGIHFTLDEVISNLHVLMSCSNELEQFSVD